MMKMWWKNLKRNPVPALAYCFRKVPRGPTGVAPSYDEGIAIKSTYAFATYALLRGLGFNSGIFEIETSDCGFAHHPS